MFLILSKPTCVIVFAIGKPAGRKEPIISALIRDHVSPGFA